MNIANLLQRVTSRQKKRERKRRNDYHEMVRQIAAGKEPTTDDVDHLLHDTGKSVDELAADVEVMTRRLKWRETYDKKPALQAEFEAMQAQIAECDKVLEAAEKNHDEETNPLYGRMSDAKFRMRECEEARKGLADTCMDNDVLNALDEVNTQKRTAHTKRCELEREIRELKQQADSDLYERRFTQWESKINKLEERAEFRKQRAVALEPELEKVHAEIADLDKREKERREQMLEP
ncbi:MAG: hypothetical protein J5I93_26600 [Pirellulaceae bacterium]|nr:hypothetical protein [Pirellulaceae bacterium]